MDDVTDGWFRLTLLGQRYGRTYRWWERVFIALGGGLFLAGLGLGIAHVIYSWRTGVWQNFLLGTGNWPFMLLIFSGFAWVPYMTHSSANSRAEVISLRRAALAGEERRAPLAEAQPESATAANLTPSSQVIRVRSPKRDTALLLAFTAGGVFLLAVPLAPVNVALSLSGDPIVPEVNTALFIGLNIAGLVLSLWTVLTTGPWAYRLFRAGRLVVDADGIRPAGVQREGAVPWSRARAFWRIEHQVPGQLSTRLYGLDTGDQLVIWSPPGGRRRQAHEALLAEIHARTGLPLRDLSAETSAIITRDKSARSARRILPMAVPLVVTLLFAGSAWLGGALAPQRFSGLVARIHAERPIYADPLSSPNADWPANGSNGMGGIPTFVDGRLQLVATSQSFTATAQTPALYQNAAVEVTVRQLSGDRFSEVGLVVRDGPWSNSAAVHFTINPRGEWSAHAFDSSLNDWYRTYNQRDPAIHTGAGAENTLLLVMRGPQYLFYCNGHYLGAYAHSPAPEAAVTLLVDGPGTTAQFSDLTIYPAPDF